MKILRVFWHYEDCFRFNPGVPEDCFYSNPSPVCDASSNDPVTSQWKSARPIATHRLDITMNRPCENFTVLNWMEHERWFPYASKPFVIRMWPGIVWHIVERCVPRDLACGIVFSLPKFVLRLSNTWILDTLIRRDLLDRILQERLTQVSSNPKRMRPAMPYHCILRHKKQSN